MPLTSCFTEHYCSLPNSSADGLFRYRSLCIQQTSNTECFEQKYCGTGKRWPGGFDISVNTNGCS